MDNAERKKIEAEQARIKYHTNAVYRARKKERMREWYLENQEKVKIYADNYFLKHGHKYKNPKEGTPERKKQKALAMRKYRRTEKGKATRERERKSSYFRANRIAHTKRWRLRNKEKHKAHLAVGVAVKSGILIKGLCEFCGIKKVVAHHDDYTKPLDVRWLCHKHHNEVHCIEASKLALASRQQPKSCAV